MPPRGWEWYRALGWSRGRQGWRKEQGRFSHTKPLAAVCLEGISRKCGHPWEVGEGPGGKGVADAAHELAKLCFVLTVVIFHGIFNHIVITKRRDHFFLLRLLCTGCLAVAVQSCLCQPALWNVRLRASPREAVVEAHGAELKAGPARSPYSTAGCAANQMQVIQSEHIFPEQITLIPTPSWAPSCYCL